MRSGNPTSGATVPTVVARGPAGRHRIALTFDSTMTDAMLHRLDTGEVDSYANAAVVDVLEARHAPATFFLPGKWVERYPDLTRRIAADPSFELASHSYAHLGFTAPCYTLGALPTRTWPPTWSAPSPCSPPTGATGRGTSASRGLLRRGGAAGGGARPRYGRAYDDVGADPFADDAAGISARGLHQAHDGAIVVLHITKANAPRTAATLPAVVDGLRARGYQLVTLSDLLVPPTPAPAGVG